MPASSSLLIRANFMSCAVDKGVLVELEPKPSLEELFFRLPTGFLPFQNSNGQTIF